MIRLLWLWMGYIDEIKEPEMTGAGYWEHMANRGPVLIGTKMPNDDYNLEELFLNPEAIPRGNPDDLMQAFRMASTHWPQIDYSKRRPFTPIYQLDRRDQLERQEELFTEEDY